MTDLNKALEAIALRADYALKVRGDLETRNNDTDDFPEVSIWGIRRMLREAYELGLKEGKGE